MKLLLLVASLLTAPACVTADHRAGDLGAPQGQAVEAVFTRGDLDTYHDVDPVQARAASFGKVVAVVDPFPWNDRLRETVPAFAAAPVTPANTAPLLSVDVVDADPLALRGWR